MQSIVSASPELHTTHTTKDFAIYAYDYSETDTPLVGQGMLSAAVASAGSVTGPMITGRVCQNVPGIFSDGVKETLEVKLRLMPVENVAKAEMKSMDIPRKTSVCSNPVLLRLYSPLDPLESVMFSACYQCLRVY